MGWSCISIGAAWKSYDMLIFHENNNNLEQLPCAENVRKINLESNGLSHLIAGALAGTDVSNFEVTRSLLKDVLTRMPYMLAEYKIGVCDKLLSRLCVNYVLCVQSGVIFQDYLKDYTHWTYTDP
jgi:hypothetical protein